MAAFVDGPILPQGAPFLAEVVLVHDIPGRLRLVAPALKSEPDRIAILRARLGQLDALRAIHFNGCELRRSRTCTPAGTPEFPAARAALTAIAH